MRVRISVKNHAPGGTFYTNLPDGGVIVCDENGEADVSKEQLAYLDKQGHIDVVKLDGKAAAE